MNFLQETLDIIESTDHTIDNVAFVGSAINEFRTDWKTFSKYADFEYDNGYGAQSILRDLVIVFNDGSWLERHEYDGSEWWEYKTCPIVMSENTLNSSSMLYDDDYYH